MRKTSIRRSKNTITLVTFENRRVQEINARQLTQLLAEGRIGRVVNKRNGCPVRAFLHRADGMARDVAGTKYSFQQHLTNGHRPWRLRALGSNPHLSEHCLAPTSMQPDFLRVVQGCLTGNHV